MKYLNEHLNNGLAWAQQEQINREILNTSICWFCDQPRAEKDFAKTVFLNKDHQMTIGLTKHHHQWKELQRKLPRCRVCHDTHLKAGNMAIKYALLAAAGCILTGFLPVILIYLIWGTLSFSAKTEDFLQFLGMLWTGVIITAMGCLATFAYRRGKQKGLALSPDTKPIEFEANHPEINPLLMNGWKIGKI